MMMNQGESTADAVASLEGCQISEAQKANAVPYSPSTCSIEPRNAQGENQSSRDNTFLPGSSHNLDQPTDPTLKNVQDGVNSSAVTSSSSSVSANLAQGYNGYPAYPNPDPYGYSNVDYGAYYNQYQQAGHYQQQPNHYQHQPNQYPQQANQYQQQANQYQQQSNQYQQQSNQYQPTPKQSYSHVGTYQNTGAAYQPLSSFQNTGSYAGPASYSGTYYNPGNYQTSGSYTNGTYGPQWHGGQYATYGSHQYQNYAPDSSSAYSSTPSAATSQYAHHYKQWEDYYNQVQTEVSCAPGTENLPVSSASSLSNPAPPGSSGYVASNNQMSQPYAPPPWRAESSSSELPPPQPVSVSGNTPEVYWKSHSTTFPNNLSNSVQSPAQKPPEALPAYNSFQSQQNPTFSQGSAAMYPASYPISQSHQSSFQSTPQTSESLDSRRASKLQIPTNPRIASNIPFSVSKDKDSSMTCTAAKPAYIGVPMQKSNEKGMPHEGTDSMFKPGVFPKSLRGYVERALARCKNDRQKAACQVVLKELITKAREDGTLHTRDWDTEPLFPMPNINEDNNQDTAFSLPSTYVKNKSPSRRTKSRWEPIPEEKPVDMSVSFSDRTVKYGGWNNKQFSGGKIQNKDNIGTKSFDHRSSSKHVARPAKRLRLVDGSNAADNGEASSDSDVEQTLTKYSAAAVALADSPEEKKRRENRSKRFDRGHGNRADKNNARAKDARDSYMHARRAGASVHRNFEESGSRAVEDLDWDSLRVKGTCQEIEKGYLRLTSAPDPATVRPEEVLEKALLMVQNSQKDYHYKCDQLKSMRQDLTVQHIRNELTVKVYETHARFAIESADVREYNQCISQIKRLYAEEIPGCHMEFAAYHLLCVILHSNNNRELLSAMSRLSADAKKDEAVKHALAVRSAVTSGNYVMFFRLYKSAPNLNAFLMDVSVEKMRYAAVKCMSRSYRPTLPVSYISRILGFNHASLPTSEEKEVDGLEECVEWLKAHGAILIVDSSGETLLDAKASMSTLYMPDPEDAVSHGDASLGVDNFLARNSSQTN
ncbi:SAC3 family protein A [Andrographis paniculata]|uniref:SAC3 family protein A n=1 Tax=Andrographis paniculata TaxID=175694 RepID=UPI0021E897DF|nr:SAC3 family protein A [Andrographis paniculata]XP_051121215.1 SAC3 family protein A [Andrographis paniculata]